MENEMGSDKIISEETSQEISAVLQMKNDGDLCQKWRTEMDDTYFCEVEWNYFYWID